MEETSEEDSSGNRPCSLGLHDNFFFKNANN